MSDKSQTSDFINRVKSALDESADHLDAGIRSRLTRARCRALEQGLKQRQRGFFTFQRVLATAAVGLLLVLGTLLNLREPAAPPVYSQIEDIEILASEDSPDFYEELEFYTWLAEEVEDAG